jgi:hypothetical protein
MLNDYDQGVMEPEFNPCNLEGVVISSINTGFFENFP